jgi:putative ABC transport system permease protein
MITNYFKTALRIMLRQKGYSAINISGLSIGIAATIIILIYIVDELGYDRMHRDAERIYRVGFSGRLQGNEIETAVSCPPLAETMQKEIPQVAEVVRFGMWQTMPMGIGDRNFTERRLLLADSNFFKFFSFPVVKGNVETFLKGPDKLVITESAALRYFGKEDPIGKMILRGAERTAAEVVGVVKDPPHNSHIAFDMVLSGESWDYMKNEKQWTSNNLYTYFKTYPGADLSAVKKHLDRMVETHMGNELERFIGMSFNEFRQQGNDLGLFIQPMLDIHLKSDLTNEITPNGNIQYLYIFAVIALFIILVACINFMNLSTARSANRAKEVGVRKTIGAFRSRLIYQFISESLLYSSFSTLLALGIISVSLGSFNVLAGKELTLSIFSNPLVIVSLLLFTAVIGIVAGSYPAFYLTSFKPTEVLKGKIRSGFKNSALRNMLVVFQFIISIALIFGSMVVYRQLDFMQKKNLGFDKENVVNLLHTLSLKTNAEAFKSELAMHPAFKGASYANNLPPRISWTSAFRKGGSEQDFVLNVYQVDHDHLKTMGYEMKEGRFFSREFTSDTAAIILNETAYRQMAFSNLDEAIVLTYQGEAPRPLKVIGVLKDFNYQSLRDNVRPMAIQLGSEPNLEMAIRLSQGNTREQIAVLESIWKKYAPDAPFEYSFVDQNFDALFRAEQRMSQIILIFTVLAITIACLGLFGLAAYTAEQRAKEISIRKVMGASMSHVMILMTKDFTILVMVAFVIATPLAWYFADSWLSGFANRIHIDYRFVIISGVISLLIALITISYQSVRAAKENPVKAMRLE